MGKASADRPGRYWPGRRAADRLRSGGQPKRLGGQSSLGLQCRRQRTEILNHDLDCDSCKTNVRRHMAAWLLLVVAALTGACSFQNSATNHESRPSALVALVNSSSP